MAPEGRWSGVGEGEGAERLLPASDVLRERLRRRLGSAENLELLEGERGAVLKLIVDGRERRLDLLPYAASLARIAEEGELTGEDEALARGLAEELAFVHQEIRVDQELHRRALIEELDRYLANLDRIAQDEMASDDEVSELAVKAARWWGRLRKKEGRVSMLWGGRIPEDLWRAGGEMVLGRGEGTWGCPERELASGALLYIGKALETSGGFAGPFRQLFLAFFGRYIELAGEEVLGSLPFFVSAEALALANHIIQARDAGPIGRAWMELARNILDEEEFRAEDIPDLLG